MKSVHLRLWYWVLAFTLLPCAGFGEPAEMVVATDGTVHKLVSGRYSELFPEGFEADAESSVLALEVLRSGSVERLLVPSTQDPYVEMLAGLHFEKRSKTTYVLWEGLVNGLHPFLHLTGYDGVNWSEPIAITGNVFADKGRADLVIVPEPELVKGPKPLPSAIARSIIYVTWLEGNLGGTEKYLVPIIFQDGVYLGWHESLRLSWLSSDDENGQGGPRSRQPMDADLENLLQIQPSARTNAVVVGFTDSNSGRLVTLEVELLPQALSALAARVGDLLQQQSAVSRTVEDLARNMRSAVMQFGQDFHQGTLAYLAAEIEALLLEHSSVAAALAPGIPEKLGVHIIHIGARVRSKGLIDSEPRRILEIGQSHEGGAPYNHLKVSILADREPPEIGGPATLFLSSTGLESLLAWEEGNTIVFRETDGDGWSDPQTVELREDLDRQTVYRILADRTLNR